MSVRAILILSCCAVLTACTSLQPSQPLNRSALGQGIQIVSTLPKPLPEGARPFPHAGFVLIGSESALGMLVPLPLVDELVSQAVKQAHDQHTLAGASRYATLDPYPIALASFAGDARFSQQAGDMQLHPVVFVQECVDDQFRFALAFQLQGGAWLGRYTYHLATMYSAKEFTEPTDARLAALRAELEAGARILRQLIDRDAAGQLPLTQVRADVGSLHLIGGRAAGLISPTLLSAKAVELIDEDAEHIVVRMPGDMAQPGSAGGLLFGLHYLRKDQLHHFKKD